MCPSLCQIPGGLLLVLVKVLVGLLLVLVDTLCGPFFVKRNSQLLNVFGGLPDFLVTVNGLNHYSQTGFENRDLKSNISFHTLQRGPWGGEKGT